MMVVTSNQIPVIQINITWDMMTHMMTTSPTRQEHMKMSNNATTIAKVERAERITIVEKVEKVTTAKVEKAQSTESTESPTLTMAVKVEMHITKIIRTARVAREAYITTIMPVTMTTQQWMTSFIFNQYQQPKLKYTTMTTIPTLTTMGLGPRRMTISSMKPCRVALVQEVIIVEQTMEWVLE